MLEIVLVLVDAQDAIDVPDDGMAFVVGGFAPGIQHRLQGSAGPGAMLMDGG